MDERIAILAGTLNVGTDQNIASLYPQFRMPLDCSQVAFLSIREIVKDHDFIAAAKKKRHKAGTEKAGSAGDQYARDIPLSPDLIDSLPDVRRSSVEGISEFD